MFLWGSSPYDFTTRALHRRGRVRVGYVLAVPDSPAVRLLDHRRVVEAPRLLNVRRLQVVSHNHILLSAKEADRRRLTGAMQLRTCVEAVHSFPWKISRAAIPCLRGASASRMSERGRDDQERDLLGACQRRAQGRADACASRITQVSTSFGTRRGGSSNRCSL